MPYPAKVLPIDLANPPGSQSKCLTVTNPVLKSRFKRLFERPFASVLKTPVTEKPAGYTQPPYDGNKDMSEEFEPSSICLAKMVQSFIEENNEKQQRCGRNRCNCFNGNCMESSDEEEEDSYNSSFSHAIDVLKKLVPSLSISEKNLLADAMKIVEKNKINKCKEGFCRKIVADGLTVLGYNAAVCKSKWEKSASIPAGEYEYVDVIIDTDRFIIEIDFRSKFEIARSTKAYKQVLQTLPNVFIGKAERLEKIIRIVSEAAKQSLKKKGMPFPPWRKANYVKAKWLSPFTRVGPNQIPSILKPMNPSTGLMGDNLDPATAAGVTKITHCQSEFNPIIHVNKCPSPTPVATKTDNGNCIDHPTSNMTNIGEISDDSVTSLKKWEPPEVKPKSLLKGVKIVTGLASVIED